MAFTPISAEMFVKLCSKNNPEIDPLVLKNKLHNSLLQYKNDVKCMCGKMIWVAGSAFADPACFTCLTGKQDPEGDYEIDQAIDKECCELPIEKSVSQSADLPSLCYECSRLNDPATSFICDEARHAFVSDTEFYCHGFSED